ncbi:transglycosylase SLT domain-containing protein [Phenylobacterium sp.]|uniref:lytic transglycosylase domain-containing protein n=1 Tax=Phenylobacterium sp. TaxID=1871053 RepID=UPI003BACF468
MPSQARKAILTAAAAVLLSGVAEAQQPPANGPRPYEGPPPPIELTQTQPTAYRGSLSDADGAALRSALESAKRADVTGARSAIAMINDPIAKKIATWALADSAADSLSFFEIDQARRDLAGWPRSSRRQVAAEKLLETSGQSPQRIIDWFGGAEPVSAEGAIALASAYRATGRSKEAANLIRHFWRDRLFEADPQRSMLARFGDVLTVDDHVRRADVILFGSQGPAARDMIPLLPADQAQLAQARMALRQNSPSANALVNALPASVSNSPGLAFERAAYMRRRGMDQVALGLVKSFPTDIPFTEMGERIWDERYQLVISSLRNGDSLGAYKAAADTGLTQGTDATEAEFYAGWIALTRLKRPEDADRHFAAIERIGSSPITRARALYWRGRAAQDRGQQDRAQGYYGAAAKYNTTFYGQLAGEKIGYGKLTLGRDPIITQADRNRFEGRETVRAARLLYEIGNKDLFKTFVLTLDDILPTAEEEALLVDLARGYGDIDTSMKVVRAAAQRGFILPERGYPIRSAPDVPGAPEPALVLGITRQESGFDPMIRSGAGARGMMQLMPGTASVVARRMGVSYSPGMLDDPDYNMRLGSSYLGQMVGTFSGSYPMAIAAYNAGPGRPTQWSAFCGDPRGAATDPIDFIECIPFSETRNYVMRVMEGMQVYRARLNGGTAPITLSQDLKRGAYGTGYTPSTPMVETQNTSPSAAAGGMRPIPN